MNAQGEDVVAGIRTPHADLRAEEVECPRSTTSCARSPPAWRSTTRTCRISSSPSQEGKLYMLQTRNGKRTGPAAVRIAVDMVEEGLIDEKTPCCAWSRSSSTSCCTRSSIPPRKNADQAAQGLRHRPGAAVGTVVFTADDAVEMRAPKRPVILVRKETTPDDIHGMDAAKGILTAIGGKTSHAAVVARGMGRPCVVGAAHRSRSTSARRSTVTVKASHHGEGGRLDLDQRHHRRCVRGQADTRIPIPSAVRQLHEDGRTSSAATSACAPMPIFRAMPRSRASSAPKASASAAPSTCSSRKTASRTCRP